MKRQLTVLILVLFMVSGAVAVNEDTLPTDQETTGDISQGELSKVGFFQGLSDSLLSFSDVQPSYEQGEQVDIRVKATATQDFDTEGAQKIVNLYRCADTGCDNPPPIDSSSEDQCSTEEWYPDYDDCTGHFKETASFSTTINEGDSWSWGVEFDAPQETGQYILVGYIFKDGQGFVTDVSEEKFTVEEKTVDSDGDGVIDSVDQCPNTFGEKDNGCPLDSDGDGVINDNDECPNEDGPESNDGCPVEETEPKPEPQPDIEEVDGDIEIQTSNQDEVMAVVELTNVGDGDMTETHIVEMQAVEAGTGLFGALSFTDYDDKVCDPDNNKAVYEEFKLDSGETRDKILTIPIGNLDEGKTYDIGIITRNKCYYDEPVGNKGVEPYGGGINIGEFTVEESSDPVSADRDGDGIVNDVDACPDKAGPESNDGCPESEIPLMPVVAGILIAVLGGVYYRYG